MPSSPIHRGSRQAESAPVVRKCIEKCICCGVAAHPRLRMDGSNRGEEDKEIQVFLQCGLMKPPCAVYLRRHHRRKLFWREIADESIVNQRRRMHDAFERPACIGEWSKCSIKLALPGDVGLYNLHAGSRELQSGAMITGSFFVHSAPGDKSEMAGAVRGHPLGHFSATPPRPPVIR